MMYSKVMGVKEIIKEWTIFRIGCVKDINFDINKIYKSHLLLGLEKYC